MDYRLRIEMLGGLRAHNSAGESIRLSLKKTGSLLAFLAYHLNRAHTRESLIEILWPNCETATGQNRLRVTLTSLRRLLEPDGVPPGTILQSDRFTAQLNPHVVTTDVAEFESAVEAAAHAETDASRRKSLERAVALHCGTLLPGLYEEWVAAEQARLSESCFRALRDLAAHFETAGDLPEALHYARRAVNADSLQEEAHCDLMRLLAAAGQPAASLRQFRELERILDIELGEHPSPSARELADRIRAGRRRPADNSFDPQKAQGKDHVGCSPSLPARLPIPWTRFFGRSDELDRLRRMLSPRSDQTCRLVTITGPGGSGKTRLAIEVARHLEREYHGATWFVALADLADSRLISDAIRDAMGLPRVTSLTPMEQVASALSARPSLIVLDNLEHLISDNRTKAEDGAALVRSLLERIPFLTCLVTSRRTLDLVGEHEFVALPLPTPALFGQEPGSVTSVTRAELGALARIPSMQLFMDRAQCVRSEFRLSPENAGSIATLCNRLEGIPLAIEMAAARARVLSPQQMLRQLDRRFEFLVSRQRDAEPRHRTLRAAMDWSYRLLPAHIQRFLSRLSVFRGGFTPESAAAVCYEPQSLEYLGHLRECSMILADESGSEVRFWMLETLREFGRDRLTPDERDGLGRSHAEYFLSLAEEAAPRLSGHDQAVWFERLEAEHDNMRAVLDWICGDSEGGEIALRLVTALRWFWIRHLHWTEGIRRITEALSREDAPRHRLTCTCLRAAGHMAAMQGDHVTAQSLLDESLKLARELDDREALADALTYRGMLEALRNDPTCARRYMEEGLAISRTLEERMQGVSPGYDFCEQLYFLGQVNLMIGDLATARALCSEAYEYERRTGQTGSYAAAFLGNVMRVQGDYADARAMLSESIRVSSELGHMQLVCYSMEWLAWVDLAEARFLRAATLCGAVEALREPLHLVLPSNFRDHYDRSIAELRAALGETSFRDAWDDGRAMTTEQVIAYALEQ